MAMKELHGRSGADVAATAQLQPMMGAASCGQPAAGILLGRECPQLRG